ncbi:hypothetical protein SDC9_154502 [bioreactor metagenome]|uniref:Uncharacterized protein n=1 Tax=bioreactor metagenome TaxID=1076179 RepID=A0A645F0M9_9ZZZZ
MQIAGQKAQPLPRLHRRTGEDDAVDRLFPEGQHGGGHGQIGLSRARRPDGQGNGVFLDGLDVLLLPDGLGLNGLALCGDADHVGGQLVDARLVAAAHQLEDIAHVLPVDGLPPGGEGQEPLNGFDPEEHRLRLAGDFQLPVPADHRDTQLSLQNADVLIEGPEDVDGLLHALDADGLFYHPCFFSFVSGPEIAPGRDTPIISAPPWEWSAPPARCTRPEG